MPLQIIRQDITKVDYDAIVNAANETLLGDGGGVDGAIHRAAGPKLLEECRTLGGCKTGHAKITKAYNLPCKYVIHTVGPRWRGGWHGEKRQLQSCYLNSLEIAKKNGCRSVAFPLISAGIFGYPKDQALRVAVGAISKFLAKNDMMVYLVIFGKADYQIGSKLFSDVKCFINDNYVSAHADVIFRRMRDAKTSQRLLDEDDTGEIFPISEPVGTLEPTSEVAPPNSREETMIFIRDQIDESFSEMLLRKIDEKGMTDAQCYKKANIDRKLFSKIRNDVNYKPSKVTVIAFAIALELSLEETRDLLMKAGFALSHSYKFDLIVEYFIRQGNFNIFEINEALFAFDQSLLGG